MFVVSYRQIGASDTLVGKIKTTEGPFNTYEEARTYATRANNKPHTPFFFFVERAA